MHLVTDTKIIQDIKSTILGFWPKRKNNFFPGPLPVSLERKNYDNLKKFPYLISLKSDGTRYFFMLFNNKEYLIDRKFDVYEVHQRFSSKIYGIMTDGCGLLIDGELINDGTEHTEYTAHDCICIYSKDISQENFIDRYRSLIEMIEIWQESQSSEKPEKTDKSFKISFKISLKKFYKFSDFTKTIFENPDHKTDGIIFTPIEKPIGTGTQFNLYKWKSVHTFDFKIQDENDQYIAYIRGKGTEGSLIKFAAVNKRRGSFGPLLMSRCPDFKSGDIVECMYNDSKEFEPLMIRKDKEHPNNIFTVEKTELNVLENITIDELFKELFQATGKE